MSVCECVCECVCDPKFCEYCYRVSASLCGPAEREPEWLMVNDGGGVGRFFWNDLSGPENVVMLFAT